MLNILKDDHCINALQIAKIFYYCVLIVHDANTYLLTTVSIACSQMSFPLLSKYLIPVKACLF